MCSGDHCTSLSLARHPYKLLTKYQFKQNALDIFFCKIISLGQISRLHYFIISFSCRTVDVESDSVDKICRCKFSCRSLWLPSLFFGRTCLLTFKDQSASSPTIKKFNVFDTKNQLWSFIHDFYHLFSFQFNFNSNLMIA